MWNPWDPSKPLPETEETIHMYDYTYPDIRFLAKRAPEPVIDSDSTLIALILLFFFSGIYILLIKKYYSFSDKEYEEAFMWSTLFIGDIIYLIICLFLL